MNTPPELTDFESKVKAVLDTEYSVTIGSRSSYDAVSKSDKVSVPLTDDDGQAEKEIAWSFDTLQNTYEINIVTKNPRIVWKGRGASAREAYQDLSKFE